jgi:hypothetical protein
MTEDEMTVNEVSDFITALRAHEQRLDALTIATGQMSQPTDYQARAELATYVRELNLTASGWQTQSELLLQLLSDHPAQMESAPTTDAMGAFAPVCVYA